MRFIRVTCKMCKAPSQIETMVVLDNHQTDIGVLRGCGVCDFKPESGTRTHTVYTQKEWFTLKDGYKGMYIHPQEPTWGYHIVGEND